MNDLQRGALACERQAPRFAYVAPLLKQAKDVAWDALKRIAWPLKAQGYAEFNEAELRVDYRNGGRVRLYGADNPDALRGIYLDGAGLDEYAQMDPAMWNEVLRPALADRRGWATFIGTPKGRDAFYKVWRQALADPEWFALMLRASETNILPASELRAIAAATDSATYAREMECSFDEPDEQQFIAGAMVSVARARPGGRMSGPRVLGVDVARQGGDFNVILYRNGDVIPQGGIERFRQPDLMQTVGRVAEAVNRIKPDAVFVDGGGVGGGVVDRLRQLGYNVIEVNSASSASDPARFKNLRAEMWSKMRDWIKDRGAVPADDQLVDDLTAPTYRFDVSNRLQLESKDDMRGRGIPSPDTADALALTFAHAVPSRDVLAVRWSTAEPYKDPFA